MKCSLKVFLVLSAVWALVLACSFPGIAKNDDTAEPPIPPVANTPALPAGTPPQAQGNEIQPAQPPAPIAADLLSVDNFIYQGAFRLPDDAQRPRTFAYGGSAMAFRPGGDPNGAQDNFPGSLFVMGHDRIPYGEVPDGNQVAEVNIPKPVISKDLAALNVADFLQGFQEVAKGHFTSLDEIPRVGMQVLEVPGVGEKVHIAWGAHFQEDERMRVSSHAWFNPDLSNPDVQGEWYLGQQAPYSINGYMLEIPPDWAAGYTGGRPLGTGRYKDGGWSGMGPALFAYRPWDDSGKPLPSGTRLEEVVLLLYEKSTDTPEIVHTLDGYQHADEWEGAAWLTTKSGKSAVLFAGTKSLGEKYWYGYINPAGAHIPCVHEEYVGQYDLCLLANGTPCPAEDLHECSGHTSERGWWSSRKSAQFILYDPAVLAQVAQGKLQSWQPQPYAVLPIDEHLLMNPMGVEEVLLGTGEQRRYRIGDASFDRQNGLLYVLELFADEAKPVVHVWRVE